MLVLAVRTSDTVKFVMQDIRVLHTVEDFKSAGLCRTLWSFATLGIEPPEGLIESVPFHSIMYCAKCITEAAEIKNDQQVTTKILDSLHEFPCTPNECLSSSVILLLFTSFFAARLVCSHAAVKSKRLPCLVVWI